MSAYAPLAVAVPLAGAALLAAFGTRLPRRAFEVIAIGFSAASALLCGALLAASRGGLVVSWLGGWQPRGGMVLGIDLAVDSLGAGLATLAGAISVAALVAATHYFDEAHARFQVLLLVFQAGLTGFALTGDLFNLFVFFELMSTASFALAGYRSEEEAALQGAINMGVTNTLGAFLVLVGIALLYGRTGALNLAQIGRAVAGSRDPLLIVAFALIACGFFVKAAVLPFHFWLLDAHAIAPTPVCALFSGVMVEAGLYGFVRVYATVFQGVLGPRDAAVRGLLVGFGAVTAVAGAILALAQRHLKRLLAASTMSHMGFMTAGFGLLDPRATAGVALYALGHGLTKAALFLGAGLVLHRLRSVDETALHGRGRRYPLLGTLFALGGLALAGVAPTTQFYGHHGIDEAARELGYGWFEILGLVVSALTGGAVLRATARIFLGLGPDGTGAGEPEGDTTEPPETPEPARHSGAPALTVPIVVLLAASLALGASQGLVPGVARAAGAFMDAPGYAAAVIDGVRAPPASVSVPLVGLGPVALSLVAALGAIAVALAALHRHRLPASLRRLSSVVQAPLHVLRAWHSGDVRDYVAWLAVGAATFGGISALALR